MIVSHVWLRWLRRAATMLATGIMLAGCGSSTTHKRTAATVPAPAVVTVKAADGVTIKAHPTRIVSLSPSATEDLYAVGAGKQVVAVDQYSTYPPDAPHTSLSEIQPNIEAIAGYKPELVVTAEDANNLVAQLGKLHIPALLEPPPANLSGVYAQLAQLGAATGHPRQAALQIAAVRGQVAAVLGSVGRPRTPLTVYHELDQTYFSASSHSFIGQLYTLLGLKNIADQAAGSSAYPQLSSEYIIARSPDLIVLADPVCCGQSYRTVAARPGWAQIAAVKHHAVLAVNDSVASEWGPRIVLFLRTIAAEVKKLEAGS